MIDGRPVRGPPPGGHRGAAASPRSRPLQMSFFEATTLLALCVFAEEGVDSACIEVGLGGRLDATNVITPEVTAITNVALDHQEYLGDTLEKIAREKAGIIKPGVPFVTAEGRPAVLAVLESRAAEVGAPLPPGPAVARHRESAPRAPMGTRFRVRTPAGWRPAGPRDAAARRPPGHQRRARRACPGADAPASALPRPYAKRW